MFWKTRATRTKRSGAALVEAAITMPVFLLLIFGMLDLGLAVLHYNVLAEAARYGAREAIVHGADAGPERSVWDPDAAEAAISEQVLPLLAASAVDLDTVTVTVVYEQDDNNNNLNAPGNPVEVTIEAPYVPLTPFLQVGTIDLEATSRMVIAN